MALAAATVLECRIGGADTNGAGFVTGSSGTDWSLQTSPQYSVTDGVTAGTTTITSATAAFGTDVVGNLISVSGGTGSITQAWYQIISRTNATTIVVDRSTGLSAGTGATLKIGGALLSPAIAASIATVGGNTVFIKYNASPFVISSASSNVAGGVITPTNNTIFCGYDTTRTVTNTDANQPTLQIQAALATTIMWNGNAPTIINLILDGNAQTSSRGSTTAGLHYRCTFKNFTNGGTNNGACLFCVFTGCSTVVACGSVTASWCVGTANTASPFSGACVSCLAYANTGATTDGFAINVASGPRNCAAYNNGRHGFSWNTSGPFGANLVAEGNGVSSGTGFGFDNLSGSATLMLLNCADFGNQSGRKNTATIATVDIGSITGSSSFFANAASGNFARNNTANAGALLAGTGFPTAFPLGLTATALDVGAAQASGATDYPTAANVRSGTTYSFGTLTGTLAVPNPNTVLTPTATDNTTGTLTLPTAGQVQTGVVFGVGGTGTTGTLQSGGGAAGIALTDTGYWYGKKSCR